MVRKPPGVAPPIRELSEVLSQHTSREHTAVLSTITPMFGGSPDPTKVDRDAPVSPRTVRGHLRFWWRALNGHRYSSLSQLFQAESRIWGSAASSHGNPSRVDITVKPLKQPDMLDPKKIQDLKGDSSVAYCGYGLFDSKTPVEGLGRFPFEVTATCDDDLWQQEVAPAIRAWAFLGGVGRRTRRGFGSLRPYSPADLLTPPGRTTSSRPSSLPYSTLPNTWLVGPRAFTTAEHAWCWILDVFTDQQRRGRPPKGRLASPVVVKAVPDPNRTPCFWPVAYRFTNPGGPKHPRIDQVWQGLRQDSELRELSLGVFPHD